MASYSVVEFEDGIHLVPTLWLSEDKTSCCWPIHLRNQYDVNKAVIRESKPHDDGKDWPSLGVKRIFCTADSYKNGMEKLCLAEETPNMEETAASDDGEDVIRAKKRRREKAKKHFTSSDEEVPEKQQQSKLQPFPAVSQFYKSDGKTSTSKNKRSISHGASASSPQGNYVLNVLDRSLPGLNKFSKQKCSGNGSSETERESNSDSPISSKENRASDEAEQSSTGVNYSLTKSSTPKLGTPRRDFLTPLPPSRTSKTNIQEYNVTKTIKHKSSYKTQDDKNEASANDGFKISVLGKLNKVLYWLEALDRRLAVLADRGHSLHVDEVDSENEEELGLPLRDVLQLSSFEEKLKSATFFAKMVKWLQRFIGTDINTSTHKILAKLMSNPLAQQYSWAGFKGKQNFKDLRLVRLVMKTVRIRVPGASDVVFADLISKWLAQAELRNTREIAKNRKQKESPKTTTKNRNEENEETATSSE